MSVFALISSLECSIIRRRVFTLAPVAPAAWPPNAVGQIAALRELAATAPISVEEAVRRFAGAKRDIVARHLETLAILGEVAPVAAGRYGVPVGAY